MCASQKYKINSFLIKSYLTKSVLLIIILSFIFLSFYQDGKIISLAFAGDAIPHYMIRSIIDSKGELGLSEALVFIKNYLNVDASFFNLETTLTNNPKPVQPYHFSVQPVFLQALLKNGFTHYTIANNHSFDYQQEGFKQTIDLVDKNFCTGFSEDDEYHYLIFEKKGFKIAFFSFSTLSNYPVDKNSKVKPLIIDNPFRDSKLLKILQMLDKEVDLLIVGVHWGEEYQFQPSNYQVRVAKFLIDNGVDIVWGSHPHVIQPFEIYSGKIIIYSCGNLISGQAYNIISKEKTDFHENYFFTRAIPLVRIYYDKVNGLKKIELIPFFQINNYFIRKSNEAYFTMLIPTKFFLNRNKDEIYNRLLENYFEGQNNKVFEYIKNNFFDKTNIQNILQADEILKKVFFSNILKEKNRIKDIIETQDSYFIDF